MNCPSSKDTECGEVPLRRPSANLSSLKRSRVQIGTFDMSGLEEASKQVESSLAFPKIEWPAYDGDDDNTDSDDDIFKPQVKRPRLGLVRSAPSFNLVALSSRENLTGSDRAV